RRRSSPSHAPIGAATSPGALARSKIERPRPSSGRSWNRLLGKRLAALATRPPPVFLALWVKRLVRAYGDGEIPRDGPIFKVALVRASGTGLSSRRGTVRAQSGVARI